MTPRVSPTPPLFERLFPQPAGELPAPELLAEVRPRERAPAERPFAFVNMISTADGRAAVEGSTRALGAEGDLEMLLELRVLADAVLIGTGTLRAEGYARLVAGAQRRARRRANGLKGDPPAVLISRSLDLPWDAGLFRSPDQAVIVYTGVERAIPELPAPVEVVRLDDPTPAAALHHLRTERGVRALLSEGGPTLNRSLVEQGLLDELFLTISPLLTADVRQPTILAGPALPGLHELDLLWVLRQGGEVYLRYACLGPQAGGERVGLR